MVKRLPETSVWLRAGLRLAVAGVGLCAAAAAQAQEGASYALAPSHAAHERAPGERLPGKPSPQPSFTITVAPLGFSPPGPIYLGQRNSLASLDFLDENRLLFTFRVPGLMHREAGAGEESDERRIRAVVLALPAGTVEAEALWTLHDRARYLWMLKDGHFLLRDRDSLQRGDATLDLKPFLHFQGPLLSVGMDPAQQYLVTNSREPAAATNKPGEVPSPANHPSDKDLSPGTPATAQANVVVDGPQPAGLPDLVVRILRRDSGQVMLVSRVRSLVHLSINSEGYLEILRGRGMDWTLNLNYFGGGSSILAHVDSACWPTADFVAEREVLVTGCADSGTQKLVAMTTGGHRLWEAFPSAKAVWPLTVNSPDGLRLARETLAVTHPVSATTPLNGVDVQGQTVEVYDAASCVVALKTPASPILDAGGNVAISPSGRRVAVLNAGAIQVFELPAPPPLPDTANQPAR
ncbi:MAG: hypothetical protein ABSC47_01800 [Terracidiphilus sp.]|jgi:hypothetical protein